MTQILSQDVPTRFTDFRVLSEEKFPVYRAFDSKTQQDVVLKSFPTTKNSSSKYQNEKSHLFNLDHPNIIKLLQILEDIMLPIGAQNEISNHLVLENATYGDLHETIVKHGRMPERLAKAIFHQLIEAITYLHSQNIAHLDLKPENLLIDGNYLLKIADFDLSQSLDSSKLENKGTASYRAPEVLKGTCTDFIAADLYSIGVILFVMVTGHPPFNETPSSSGISLCKLRKFFNSHEERFWDFHSATINDYSIYNDELKDLLKILLAENPKDRTLENVKQSAWFQNENISNDVYLHEIKTYLNH